jgi:hypothetical protein
MGNRVNIPSSSEDDVSLESQSKSKVDHILIQILQLI